MKKQKVDREATPKDLEKIAKILRDFIKKYNFNMNYLKIEGTVVRNVHSRLNIFCIREFDDFTLEEIKKISSGLYEKIRKYLETESIVSKIYIEEAPNTSWYQDGIVVKYETSVVIK